MYMTPSKPGKEWEDMMTPIKENRSNFTLVLSAHWTFEDLF